MTAALARLLGALRRAIQNYVADDCALLAAAIAFYSLLSLAPALYLVAAALGPLVGESVSRRIVENAASFLPSEALPTLTAVEQSLQVGGTLIVLALPGLLWIATHAFSALQRALNVAFSRRPGLTLAIWHGRAKGMAALLATAVLVGSLLVVHSLLPLLGQVGALVGVPRAAGPVAGGLRVVLPPAIVFFVFYMAYRLLPTGRVPRRPAAMGALLALALWKTSLALFGALVRHSPAFGIVTGTLAGLLGFLFWTYTGVAVVLVGAEFAAVLNGDRDRRKQSA